MSKLINELENVLVNVKVKEIPTKEDSVFEADAQANLFDPEKMLPQGGPVTKKSVQFNVRGKTFDEARENALNLMEVLLGLKGE